MTLSQIFTRQSAPKMEAVHLLDALAAIATSAEERLHPIKKDSIVTESLSIFELLDFTPMNKVSNGTTLIKSHGSKAEQIKRIVAQQATIMGAANKNYETSNSDCTWYSKVAALEKNLNDSEGLTFQDIEERAEFLATVADCFNKEFGKLEISGIRRIRIIESHPHAFVNPETNEIEVIRKWEAAKCLVNEDIQSTHTSYSNSDGLLSFAAS